MTFKKAQARVQELKKEEIHLFDTYKVKKRPIDRVNHLRQMANVIEEADKLKKKFNIK